MTVIEYLLNVRSGEMRLCNLLLLYLIQTLNVARPDLKPLTIIRLVGPIVLIAIRQRLPERIRQKRRGRQNLKQTLAELPLIAVFGECEVVVGDDVEFVDA
jgi:hypothetical protein